MRKSARPSHPSLPRIISVRPGDYRREKPSIATRIDAFLTSSTIETPFGRPSLLKFLAWWTALIALLVVPGMI